MAMLKLALTGGIGSGKSTAAAMLAEHGAVIIDADAAAREAVEPGTPGLVRVVERFGREILRPDGSLDRPELGRRVFADADALADLNAIVHPLVGERVAELTARAVGARVVVYDVPLLVENGLHDAYDAVLVVQAPLAARLERLAERGLPADEARSRMARQATDAQRQAVATIVLDNSGPVEALRAQVAAAWQQLAGRAASG